jgi:PAS domain S-box-containing protein
MGEISTATIGLPSGQSDDGDALLRQLLEALPGATCLVGMDGRIVLANSAFGALLGHAAEECPGLPFDTFVLGDDTAPRPTPGVLNPDLDSYRGERRYCRKDGSAVAVLVAARLWRSEPPRPACLVLQITDISALEAREAALIEAESRWNYALEGAHQGVWDHHMRNDSVFYSRMWRQMRGYGPDDDVDALAGDWFARLHPDDLPRIKAITDRQNTGEIATNELE